MTGIYKITNPKGRVYIGQSKNLEKRKNCYFNLHKSIIKQVKIYNSLLKYGTDNHKFEIIEQCSEEKLTEREIYWKTYYLSLVNNNMDYVLFHNIVDGLKYPKSTNWRKIRCKELLEYDLEGNFIKEWPSANEYSIKNNLTNGTLLTACARNKVHSAYGSIWKYKTKNYSLKINPVFREWERMKIIQYNLNGEQIREWDSILEAAEQFGSRGQNIINNLKQRSKSAHGFVWKYK